MAITVSERRQGRRLDNNRGEIEYLVSVTQPDVSTFDVEEARTEVFNTAPGTFGTIPLSNVRANDALVDLANWQLWSVTAEYSFGQPVIFPTSDVQYEFSFQAEVGHIFLALNRLSVSVPAGESVPTVLQNDLKIRQTSDGDGGMRTEGVSLPSPSPSFAFTFTIPNGTVTQAYQQTVEGLMGSVNSLSFKSRAADTVRFVGCRGGVRNQNDWSVRFEFRYSPNRTNVVIPVSATESITVPSIPGHAVVWDFSADQQFDPNAKVPMPKTTAIVVDEVFPREDFSVLGL